VVKSPVPDGHLLFIVLHVTLIICMYNIHKAWHSSPCCISCSSCYNRCLVVWTIVHLTAAKLKPLICFYVGLHLFRCGERLYFHDFVWPFLVACTVSLCSHKYTVLRKSCAPRGPVCTSEIYQWCGEPYYASAAISKDGFLQKIPRRGKHKSLLI
jgi:hypothetical protein